MASVGVASSSNTTVITISQVNKLDLVQLPEVSIHGIPWKVQVCKHENDEQQSSLSAFFILRKR